MLLLSFVDSGRFCDEDQNDSCAMMIKSDSSITIESFARIVINIVQAIPILIQKLDFD